MTNDDIDGYDFKVTKGVRTLRFVLEIDGIARAIDVEAGATNHHPAQNPSSCRSSRRHADPVRRRAALVVPTRYQVGHRRFPPKLAEPRRVLAAVVVAVHGGLHQGLSRQRA